ncbi:hypothetical protein ACF1BN_28775 [Streptomyces sp. NPDC014861]|uniref:hypothetical protein n=1 Tax=Streptomyces sp. NPDC014861 TaxID=3364923 RepID=UPI0036FD708F
MRPRTAAVAALAVLAVLGTGCGIRTTSVPVDAGAAPSRVPCNVTEAAPTQGVLVRAFLVCGSQLEPVDRRSPQPEDKVSGDPVRTASALLAQLLADPSDAERQAGFTTAVRAPLEVAGGRAGDPEGTLRLSRQPEDLAPAALSQLVCTFAESSAGAGGHTVLLAGPGAYPPKRYRCTTQLRERPESAPATAPVPTPARTPAEPSAG